MLITNFLKINLQGDWKASQPHSDFTLYADIGFACSSQKFSACFKAYRCRVVPDYLMWMFEKCAESIYRKYISDENLLHKAAKGRYGQYKKKKRSH